MENKELTSKQEDFVHEGFRDEPEESTYEGRERAILRDSHL